MNQLVMMAMAVSMNRGTNSSATAQTVLGAADGLGQTGRLALGMVRQRNEEQDRLLAEQRTGQELRALLLSNKITQVDWSQYPTLKRAVDSSTTSAAPASSSEGHTMAAGTGIAAAPGSTATPVAPPVVSHPSHEAVPPKFALADDVGRVLGYERVVSAADAAASQAQSEASTAAANLAEARTALTQALAEVEKASTQDAKEKAGEKASKAAAKVAELEVVTHKAKSGAHAANHAAQDLKAILAAQC